MVDLAGLTDPAIAVLARGPHLEGDPPRLLDARGVDTLVLLLKDDGPPPSPWTAAKFARTVETRIAAMPEIGDAFTPAARSTGPGLGYLVLRRVPKDPREARRSSADSAPLFATPPETKVSATRVNDRGPR